MREIAVVAAAYPVVWGGGQLGTGWLSDHTGRRPLIAGGMIVRKHYDNGADLVDDFADKKRRLPDDAVPGLLEPAQPCAVRERCRTPPAPAAP